jgi:hypothetical protein
LTVDQGALVRGRETRQDGGHAASGAGLLQAQRKGGGIVENGCDQVETSGGLSHGQPGG